MPDTQLTDAATRGGFWTAWFALQLPAHEASPDKLPETTQLQSPNPTTGQSPNLMTGQSPGPDTAQESKPDPGLTQEPEPD